MQPWQNHQEGCKTPAWAILPWLAGHPVHCPLGRDVPTARIFGKGRPGSEGASRCAEDPAGQGSGLCPSLWVPGWGCPFLPQEVQPSQLTSSASSTSSGARPGRQAECNGRRFPASHAHLFPYQILIVLLLHRTPPLSRKVCSSGAPRLGHRGRGATCCPRGVSAASGARGIPIRPPPAPQGQ